MTETKDLIDEERRAVNRRAREIVRETLSRRAQERAQRYADLMAEAKALDAQAEEERAMLRLLFDEEKAEQGE